MKTRLFIENQEVELDESVHFAITKQFEDLSNPTKIINTWSKTVSIPFTQKNNNLFGHIYNPDRLISSEGTTNVGIYFDPYKKLDFRLQWGDSILMTGYAKMNEVKQNNGKGTYDITLFGQLGKILQELKKITFNTKTTDTNYLIDGSEYVDDKINRTLVYNSWTSEGQTHDQLYPKYFYPSGSTTPVQHPAYNVTDIIGFAPNNSFSEEFEYKSLQTSTTTSTTFADFLGSGFAQDTGISADTVINNGLLPRGFGEFRSYFQLPFIYWNKLFKIFQKKAESITGYTFDLDSNWFTTTNPYWYKLVYMLKPLNFSNKDATGETNTYVTTNDVYTWNPTRHTRTSGHGAITYWWTWDGTTTTNVNSFSQQSENIPLYVGSGTFQINSDMLLSSAGNFEGIISVASDDPNFNIIYNPNQAFKIVVTYTGVNNSNTITKTIVVASRDAYNSPNPAVVDLINNADSVGIVRNNQAYVQYDSSLGKYVYYINFTASLPKFNFNVAGLDSTFNIKYTTTWVVDENNSVFRVDHEDCAPLLDWSAIEGGGYTSEVINLPIKTDLVLNLNMDVKQGVFYSGSRFTLNDLWNNEYNLFEEIIKYCKMYRILINVDDLHKKISFKRSTTFFQNYSYVDWTDKIDKSKDFNIKPITFDNKYVLFNYKDSKTAIGEEYKKTFGINYGDFRLITDYNFNDNTTELFKDITPSILSTDNILSWLTLVDHRIAYTMGAEIFVNNKDKDKKQVDVFGAYFFHNGTSNFDTGSGLVGVNITDDTTLQMNNSTLFYHVIQSNRTYTTKYPNLDIINDNNMCVFNIPSVNYTYKANYSGKNSIYKNFWENYINERYNVQNKMLTCYIKLKPQDWSDFDFNHFVSIGNQLYIVNKIYDYNIESTSPTKVDLITVSNISGYTN